MAPHPPRPPRRIPKRHFTGSAGTLAGVAVLLLAAMILAVACRSPASPGPSPSSDSIPTLPDAPAIPDALPPPVLTVAGDTLTHNPGARVHLPRPGDAAREITLWFAGPLAGGAERQVRVEPEEALAGSAPAGGDDLGRPPTGLRLLLVPPADGSPVNIVAEAGLAAADGRELAETATFEVVFAEPTYAYLALSGPGYLPGSGEERFTGVDSAARRPVLRPGSAVLEASFTRPVDPDSVEAALLRRLPPEIRPGVPSWNPQGTELRLPLFQNVTRSLTVSLSLAAGAGEVPARDRLGMPLTAPEPDLRWIVAAPAPIVATGGDGADPAGPGEPAGQLPDLPLLNPAGPHALRAGRLLAWLAEDGYADCHQQALTLWELASGTGLTLAESAPGCLSWTAWIDDDTVVVVDDRRVTRYRIPQALPLADLLPGPQVTDLWTSEAGAVVGAALAPGAPIALFHAPAAGSPDGGATDLGGSTRVDLVILDSDGRVTGRFSSVSDLVSQEPTWRPLPAAWSADGRWLAFAGYRSSSERDEAGYPSRVKAELVIFDGASRRLTRHDLAPLDLIWRPGSAVLWVRTGAGWSVLDPATGAVQPVDGHLWWALAFSPDGRYLTGSGPQGPAILDAAAGSLAGAPAPTPLGWDPVDGRAYWQEH